MTGIASTHDAVVIGAFGVSTNVVLLAGDRGHDVEVTFTGWWTMLVRRG